MRADPRGVKPLRALLAAGSFWGMSFVSVSAAETVCAPRVARQTFRCADRRRYEDRKDRRRPGVVGRPALGCEDAVPALLRHSTQRGHAVERGQGRVALPGKQRLYRRRALHRPRTRLQRPHVRSAGTSDAVPARRPAHLAARGRRHDGAVAVGYDGKKLNSPNDLVFDDQGTLYFTDPPFGLPGTFTDPGKELPFNAVFRVAKDGKITAVANELEAPNGLGFSPDYKTLYVANARRSARSGRPTRCNADGTLDKGRIFADSSSYCTSKATACPTDSRWTCTATCSRPDRAACSFTRPMARCSAGSSPACRPPTSRSAKTARRCSSPPTIACCACARRRSGMPLPVARLDFINEGDFMISRRPLIGSICHCSERCALSAAAVRRRQGAHAGLFGQHRLSPRFDSRRRRGIKNDRREGGLHRRCHRRSGSVHRRKTRGLQSASCSSAPPPIRRSPNPNGSRARSATRCRVSSRTARASSACTRPATRTTTGAGTAR